MQRVAPPIQGRLSERETVAVLFGVLFLATVDNSLLISLLPRIELELGVAIQRLGWIFSAYALAAALSNLVVGPLTDRWGRIGFLRLAVMAFVALGIATYLSRGFEQLLILRTLNGAAGGAVSTCAVSLVGDAFPYRRRGRIMGMVLSAYFVALIVGVPGGVTVSEYWGWRSVFLANGGLALVLSIWLLRRFSLDRRPQPLPAAGLFTVYRKLLKGRQIWAALAVSFATSGATLSVLTFVSGLGITPRQISWLFLITGLAALVGSPLAGLWSDRLGKRTVFLVANTLMAFPLLFLTRVPWGWGLVTLFFVISLLVASRQTALQTLQTELIPDSRRGAFLGLRNGCSQLGIASSVFVAGQLYVGWGYAGVTVFAALLTLLASGLLLLAVTGPLGSGRANPHSI